MPALIVGAVAALAGGAAWAALVVFASLEAGIVAWGIGLAVGLAMAAVTPSRGQAMAVLAALIAAVGLVAGKAMIVTFATQPALAEEIEADGEWLAEAAVFDLQSSGALPVEMQQKLEALAFDDTIPDALWLEMLSAGTEHAESVGSEGRAELAAQYASFLLSGTDFMTLLGAQMSLWDLLWFGLAISTAWRIMSGKQRQGMQPGEADA
ncbi:MAG: hypothetical protein PVJ43_09695 [Gemmatimonadales bacterium]|jgi:hypothetical protein